MSLPPTWPITYIRWAASRRKLCAGCRCGGLSPPLPAREELGNLRNDARKFLLGKDETTPIKTAKANPAVTPDSNPGDPAYLKIRDMIYRISGIYHAEEKLYLLIGRCGRRMV